jgi:hypothetical protein
VNNIGKAGLLTIVLGIVLFALGASPLFAQNGGAAQNGTMTHEQMHQMMDAMHGEGTSDRMHDAMGADVDRIMDQCVAMMNMMQMMAPMPDMRNAPAPSGPDSQSENSMRGMMNRMMGW